MITTVICKRSKPPPPTADASCIAIDEPSQRRFLCKGQDKSDWLPLAEYLSQSLARRCGLVVPDCFVVRLEADPLLPYFGSQWEGGAENYSAGMFGTVTNHEEFSRIFAFDLLIHNVDRHANNYLYLQLAGDTVVKAMDHSRTWWYSGWPLPPPPPPAGCATVVNAPIWKAEATWNEAAALEVVNAWSGIQNAEISDLLQAVPPEWIGANRKDELLAWWGSPGWLTRNAEAIAELT